MNRREFISSTALAIGGLTLMSWTKSPLAKPPLFETDQETRDKFSTIISDKSLYVSDKAVTGYKMQLVSKHFEGIPYVGGTLEGSAPEQCRFTFTGMDCVTFMENTLCMARIVNKGYMKIEDLAREIIHTRYRQGILNGYTSRLHYTADWIYDNAEKAVVTDMTRELGGIPKKFKLDFMSTHPQYYKPLQQDSAKVEIMKQVEAEINERQYYYIPISDIQSCQDKFLPGDIITIVTNIKGLDYSHVGIIVQKDGQPRFMHASSKHKKIIVDKTLPEYLSGSKTNIGISVIRPLVAFK